MTNLQLNFQEQLDVYKRQILSSSLHGIILSDAYGIPNCWVEFSDDIDKSFKFNDYYLSVGKERSKPIKLERFYTLEELDVYKRQVYFFFDKKITCIS